MTVVIVMSFKAHIKMCELGQKYEIRSWSASTILRNMNASENWYCVTSKTFNRILIPDF